VVVVQPCRVKAAGVNNIQDSCRYTNSYLCLLSYNKKLSISNSCCSHSCCQISKVDMLTSTLEYDVKGLIRACFDSNMEPPYAKTPYELKKISVTVLIP
jgi:hypothetical protein